MDNEFQHFCPISDNEKSQIWKKGLIILDTNVLLNIYRYSNETRNEFIKILKHSKINKRLWIPYQVAQEFHKNRATVIVEQKEPYQKISSIVKKNFTNLVDEIKKTRIHKHHPFLDITSVVSSIEESCGSIIEDLNENAKQHPVLISDDDYLKEIHIIFESKYGDAPDSETLEKLIAEGKKRFDEKTPPGYMDSDKEGDNKYGDYILWTQILGKAKLTKKDVVFVTDDDKEDWWQRIKGMTIGARPELRKEFREETGQKFIIYNSATFFDYAQKIAEIGSSDKAINETLDLVEQKRTISFNINQDLVQKIFEIEEKKRKKKKKIRKEKISKKPTVQEMVDWFYTHYEDPANGVPYESKEGGYQYIFGGPYDPQEELSDEFVNAEYENIEKAGQEIYSNGFEWVKIGEY